MSKENSVNLKPLKYLNVLFLFAFLLIGGFYLAVFFRNLMSPRLLTQTHKADKASSLASQIESTSDRPAIQRSPSSELTHNQSKIEPITSDRHDNKSCYERILRQAEDPSLFTRRNESTINSIIGS